MFGLQLNFGLMKFMELKTSLGILPGLVLRCEIWIPNQRTQQKLDIHERKILVRIFGGTNTDLGWGRRMNISCLETNLLSNFWKLEGCNDWTTLQEWRIMEEQK